MSTTNKTYLDLNGLTQYDEKIKEYIEYTEITYEDWLELTDEEKETGKWYVTGVPGADGTVSIDLMTKLWENPSPTSSFAAQNIQLSSSDYDLLLVMGRYKKNSTNNCASIIGNNGYITFTDYVNSVAMAIYRGYGANGTTVSFSDAFANGNTDNDRCIPYQIYGIKLHHTVEIKAIAPEVSTLASKCMMSDGTTTVEDAVDELKNGLITPSGTHLLLGYSAINGTNIVSVSLGNNNISDYDFLWVGTSYYYQGVATYGCTLLPVVLMQNIFTGDAGVCFISRDSTNAGVMAINVRYNHVTNSIEFMPTGTPNGNYYYVDGIKIRTAS